MGVNTVMWRTRVTKSGEAQQYGEPHSPKSEGLEPNGLLEVYVPWNINRNHNRSRSRSRSSSTRLTN